MWFDARFDHWVLTAKDDQHTETVGGQGIPQPGNAPSPVQRSPIGAIADASNNGSFTRTVTTPRYKPFWK